MMRRNRYRKIPPNPNRRKKRERKSKPLERSVHINEKRWGWEFAFDRKEDCDLPKSACKNCIDIFCMKRNKKIKIVSPDNRYFEISFMFLGNGLAVRNILTQR